MSLSVNGSNTNNPLLSLQSLWQQVSSSSGTQTASDPLSSLLAAIGQQSAGTAATSPANATGTSTAVVTGGTAAQFGPQTLQALLALQSNGSTPQSLASQFGNAANGADPLSALASGTSQTQHGHHHHHHMNADGGNSGSGAGTGAGATGTTGGAGSQTQLTAQWLQMQTQLSTPATAQSSTTV